MPTIKSLTFHKGEHHATCGARRKYLEADGRHLGREAINIADVDRWDREMDRTREAYLLRGSVSYREFILSPDPKDNVSLCQLRDLARRWALENFADAEVCIVFHDDNKERLHRGEQGILHAHIVVNSVNLATGKKVVVKNADVRELHNSVQRIAEDLGFSVMEQYRPGKRLVSDNPERKSRTERQLEMRGIKPWKASVRDMALQSLEVAQSPQEFVDCLDKADVDVIVKQGQVFLADRDNPTRACRASGLSADLMNENIKRQIARNALVLNNYRELHLFAQNIGAELAQGDAIRRQYQVYDERCRDALKEYREIAKRTDGVPVSKFPAFTMPDPVCRADIVRRHETQQHFQRKAEAYRSRYARFPRAKDDHAHPDQGSGSHSHNQSIRQVRQRGNTR